MNIAALIERAGGVADLAMKLGVARTTVLGWKKDGMIPGNRIAQISAALDVQADDLLPLSQPPRSARRVVAA